MKYSHELRAAEVCGPSGAASPRVDRIGKICALAVAVGTVFAARAQAPLPEEVRRYGHADPGEWHGHPDARHVGDAPRSRANAARTARRLIEPAAGFL